jgi:hypothetical protein
MLYNLPGIHNPHLDFEERGAYVAHGALIENILISAPHYGYAVTVGLFPDVRDADLVAYLDFTEREAYDDPLYHAIPLRATNHHPFQEGPLRREVERAIVSSVEGVPSVRLALLTSREDREAVGRIASRVEVVILEDESITESFFSGMVWTTREEKTKKSGFFVKSLEFNPIQMGVFRLASNPHIMRVFRKIGIPQFIAHQDARLYATGSVAGGILVPDDSKESYLMAGRALERVWLTATAEGLAFQPLVGTCFVAYKSEVGKVVLPDARARDMHRAFTETKRLLRTEAEIPVLLFRIGVAPAPSVRSSRRDVFIESM